MPQLPQFPPTVLPMGVVFDADMGNELNTPLALGLLYGLEGKSECRVISLSTTKSNLKSAAYLDVIVRFYMSATAGPIPEFRRIPGIGMSELGWSKSDTPMLDAVLSKPEFVTGVKKFNDTAEPHALIRNMLTAQQDGNVAIVLAGPAGNLLRALELQNVPSLLEKKVKYLVTTEQALARDPASARKLFANWPTPIYVVESGVKYPWESLDRDFAWAEGRQPIVAGVRAAGKSMDIPAPDMAAAMYAVRPKDPAFVVGEPGNFVVSDSGKGTFTTAVDGIHRRVAVDPGKSADLVKAYIELVSAKPVVRTFTRRPKADAAMPPDDKKPEDIKP